VTAELHTATALAVLAAIFLCAFWFAPGGVLALRRRADGALQVDLRVGYSPDTLYRLLDLYGEAGRRSFRALLLADMIFPAVYGATLYLFGDLLGSAFPRAASLASAARYAAIAAALFDYGENLFLLHVLRHRASRPTVSAHLAGICTTLKMTAFAIAALSLVAGWVIS
jgi:integrase